MSKSKFTKDQLAQQRAADELLAEQKSEERRLAAQRAAEEEAKKSAAPPQEDDQKQFAPVGDALYTHSINDAFDALYPKMRVGNVLQFPSEEAAQAFFQSQADAGQSFLYAKQNADGTPADTYAISVGDGSLIYGSSASVKVALSAYGKDSPYYETAQSYLQSLGSSPAADFRNALKEQRDPGGEEPTPGPSIRT